MFGGCSVPPEKVRSTNRYKTMQEMWGITEGKKCKTCTHCVCRKWDKKYYKCELWCMSHSTATDIRLKNQACGKYEEDIINDKESEG